MERDFYRAFEAETHFLQALEKRRRLASVQGSLARANEGTLIC